MTYCEVEARWKENAPSDPALIPPRNRSAHLVLCQTFSTREKCTTTLFNS
jgi:hypothetical protein